MINKSLVALVMAGYCTRDDDLLPLGYFESHGLNGEGTSLEKQGFLGMASKDGKKGYRLTNIGKDVLSELELYYDIISVEHL